MGSFKAELRLDVLIKKEEDYYQAHCLQFDLVATDDTLAGVKQAIVDLCLAHIRNSVEYDNMEYLFSPAPKEAWSEYLAMANDASCEVISVALLQDQIRTLPPFVIQEIVCHGQNAPLS